MAVRKFKPVTPGQRNKVISSFSEITARKPQKSLLEPLKSTGGRNNTGQMTVRYLGGGHKKMYRIIDFLRDKDECTATVQTIEYDPNRSARIALVQYEDGEKRYIIAPDGIKVIEFNCRFGDPETEVVLPRLESDFYLMLSAIADGTEMPEIKWSESAALGFVLASKGYPGSYSKGAAMRIPAPAEGVRYYHMGTARKNGSIVTAGGRVLMPVALAPTLKEARDLALSAAESVDCDNLFFRRDIGHQVIQ